jgi:hypothetical protein
MDTKVQQGTSVSSTDTPTHRTTLSQLNLSHIAQLVDDLQARRAAVVEKVRKAKENSKVAEERKINKQLERILKKIEKKLQDAESYIDIAADELNKARGLFLEISDGQVLLSRTELTHGSITKNTPDRGSSKASST